MKIRVLGCSGGIGKGIHTTCFQVSDEILIDVGSGVGELTLEEMGRLRHVFLTHSHLDHVHALPLLVDSAFDWYSKNPLVVHALPETIEALRKHIFNWVMWPDFSALPDSDHPSMIFEPMEPGEAVVVDGHRFEMIPVNHTVPTVAYVVEKEGRRFAFSGDTSRNDTLWEGLNGYNRLDLLIVEAAFTDSEQTLCRDARHYCPQMLADDLGKLKHQADIYLTHAKPGAERQILEQCRALINGRTVHQLSDGDVLTL